jgi:hypothetical protein
MIVTVFRSVRAFLASVGLILVASIVVGVVMEQRGKRRRG